MSKLFGLLFVAATLTSAQSAVKEVVYVVDGTAKYANLTLTKNGATEQTQVPLPFESRFFGKAGEFLYLSAQKVRVTKTQLHAFDQPPEEVYNGVAGNVHVLIKVSGTVLQEATSDAPYGIATVRGKLPD
jgi:hypothetical protein